MSAGQHTPGPWRIGEGLRGYEFGVVKPIEMGEIGIADIPEGIHRGEAEANVRLIAAAPELLETLVMVRDADNDCRRDGLQVIPAIARARIDVVIAKASGVT